MGRDDVPVFPFGLVVLISYLLRGRQKTIQDEKLVLGKGSGLPGTAF